MRGKASAEFPFDTEIERTFHSRRRQARLAKLSSEEELISVHSDSESKHRSEHKETDSKSKFETKA